MLLGSLYLSLVMLDRPCSEVERKSTGYPLHSRVSPSLPSSASPCAIRFQLSSTFSEVSVLGLTSGTWKNGVFSFVSNRVVLPVYK